MTGTGEARRGRLSGSLWLVLACLALAGPELGNFRDGVVATLTSARSRWSPVDWPRPRWPGSTSRTVRYVATRRTRDRHVRPVQRPDRLPHRRLGGVRRDRRRAGLNSTGAELYEVWDRHNKEAQRTTPTGPWVSFRELSRRALAAAYGELGLAADPGADLARVHGTVGDWPLWPDVAEGVRDVAERARVGILSNVDDDLAAATRAYGLVDPALVLTSQRLRAYKPDAAIYRRARERAGELVHVAASARDVRGALESGIATVRLVRQGHRHDPAGPVPDIEVTDARDLPAALSRLG